MNILLFIEGINIGGQQTYTYNLLKRLNTEKTNAFVSYITDGDLHERFEEVSKGLFKLGDTPKNWKTATKNPFHIIKSGLKLKKLLKTHKIDIVVTNGTYTYAIGALAAFLSGIKHVRVLGKEPSKEKFYWKYFNIIPLHKFTDLYFGFSFGNKELKSKGVENKKLVDLGNAVDTQLFAPKLSAEEVTRKRIELGIGKDQLAIGWVGRIYANMEVKYTVDMAKSLLDLGFYNFKFLVIGDGPWMDKLKEKIAGYGLSDYTIFMGWQPMAKIPELIQLMDIMPLLDNDPIGGSIVREAMSCGTTVLSVDGKSGYQAEWVKNNINGVLVKPENYIEAAAKACIDLYKNPEKRLALGKEGRAYAIKHMDFSIKAKIFEEQCEQLVASI